MSWFHLRLPGGQLKFKPYRELRRREIERQVPVWHVGGIYIVWWPKHLNVAKGAGDTS
jgi:hypothetical protein